MFLSRVRQARRSRSSRQAAAGATIPRSSAGGKPGSDHELEARLEEVEIAVEHAALPSDRPEVLLDRPMPVRVQIAGVSSLEEALFLERAGADALGLTVRLPTGVHDGLTEAKARSLVAALPPFVSSVAITYVDNAREAVDLCRYLGVAALQLHGPFPTHDLELLRAALPHLKLIRAVHVTGPEAVAQARSLERRVDALILDTYDPTTGRGGATGKTHDWALSREIVTRLRVPVILAGGLTPENVAAAIAAVRPWGVDVHTGVESADGARDRDKMRRFVEAAKAAGGE